MIKSISSFLNVKTNNNFTNSKQSTQIYFKGNLAKLGENLVEAEASKFGGKIRRLAGEATDIYRGFIKKITGKDELPIIERPLIAPTSMNPLEHISSEDLASQTANRKGPIQKMIDTILGPKEAQAEEGGKLIRTAADEGGASAKSGKLISEIGHNSSESERPIDLRHSQFDSQGNLTYIVREGDANAPALSKFAAQAEGSVEKAVQPSNPKDIIWGSDGNPLYVLSDADKAAAQGGSKTDGLNFNKLVHEAEQGSKGVEESGDPSNLVFDSEGNVVYKIPDETHTSALEPEMTDLDSGLDLDID